MLGLKGLIAMVHEKTNLSKAIIQMPGLLQIQDKQTTYIKEVHERMKPFKCDTYRLKFYIMASLKKHVKTFHEGKKPQL